MAELKSSYAAGSSRNVSSSYQHSTGTVQRTVLPSISNTGSVTSTYRPPYGAGGQRSSLGSQSSSSRAIGSRSKTTIPTTPFKDSTSSSPIKQSKAFALSKKTTPLKRTPLNTRDSTTPLRGGGSPLKRTSPPSTRNGPTPPSTRQSNAPTPPSSSVNLRHPLKHSVTSPHVHRAKSPRVHREHTKTPNNSVQTLPTVDMIDNKPSSSRDLDRSSTAGKYSSSWSRRTSNYDIDSLTSKYRRSCSIESGSPLSPKDEAKGNGIVGLKNLGNTCFMNSILQCLSHSPKVREYFLTKKYKEDLCASSKMQGRLAEEFANLLTEMWSGRNDSVSPTKFKSTVAKSAPRFVGYSQQDSQEFLRFFLEGLHEDLNKGKKGKRRMEEPPKGLSDTQLADHRWSEYVSYDNSAIVDIFVGLLKSTLTCTVCDHASVTFDPFWDLSLPLPRGRTVGRDLSIKGCFEDFSQEEDLDGDEKPQCEACKKRQRCTKRFTIERYPPILVLHLKRFSEVRYRNKLSTRVDFPTENLDLSKFSSNPKDSSAPLYNLIGVSNHSGNTFSGHYTAYCKTGSRWNRFSDTSVSSVSASDLATSEAYVLFYERKQ